MFCHRRTEKESEQKMGRDFARNGKKHVTKSLVICPNKKCRAQIKMARNEKLDKYLLLRLNVISLFIEG